MFNNAKITQLVSFIQDRNGKCDKKMLSEEVKQHFELIQDGKVFVCQDFVIRFCSAKTRSPGNTVISLSVIKQYDNRPFIVCIVTPIENFLLLSNSSFLKKVSHSSQDLRVDNIRGSINASDIMREISGYENSPCFFSEIFSFHMEFTFEENLIRLVEATNNIVATGRKYERSSLGDALILNAPERAIAFINSPFYDDLKDDLNERVSRVKNEIAIAAFIDNVNIRGRIIEYLITSDAGTLRDTILDSLKNNGILPAFSVSDDLGDYQKKYNDPKLRIKYDTATDIKTKILFLDSAPKAYNIDKLLTFLSTENSVYMFFFIGIDENKKIMTGLFSPFDARLLKTTRIQHHWAGRNSRGVTQLSGDAVQAVLFSSEKSTINNEATHCFLQNLLDR